MTLSLETYKGKTVLITGATGFTGKQLTTKLVECGAKVRVIARDQSNIDDLEALDIQWFRGEVINV